MKNYMLIFSIVIGASLTSSWAQDVTSIMEKAAIEGKKLTLPTNKYTSEGLKAAEETTKVFNSPEFQEKVRCEEQRLAQEVFADHTAPWENKRNELEKQREQNKTLTNSEKIYLFFSSSVPNETLQAYIAAIAQADDPNLVLTMKGWPSGTDKASTEADTKYFSKILQKESSCQGIRTPCEHYLVGIQMQASLFSKYGISQVPAVIYIHDKETYKIQGDAGLDYLLERINREAKSETLNNLITKIRTP